MPGEDQRLIRSTQHGSFLVSISRMDSEFIPEAPRHRPNRVSSNKKLIPPETTRRTRSRNHPQDEKGTDEQFTMSAQPAPSIPSVPSSVPQASTSLEAVSDTRNPVNLPAVLTTAITGLSKRATALLHKKQRLLRDPTTQTRLCDPLPGRQRTVNRMAKSHSSAPTPCTLHPAVAATLVFAQEAAGTAVCVHPSGLLLTCAHCVAESAEELDKEEAHWLLFADGKAVKALCVAYNASRDLALLRIVASQVASSSASSRLSEPAREFSFVQLSAARPKKGAPLICIGHAGSEDLEAETVGVASGYDVLHVSEGAFRGYAPGQSILENEEIGALMHDCWTYWGHSGAPLVQLQAGNEGLVGLHSSWDDSTGMRRGVGWEAVQSFLNERSGEFGEDSEGRKGREIEGAVREQTRKIEMVDLTGEDWKPSKKET